jgi:hypothetical protein
MGALPRWFRAGSVGRAALLAAGLNLVALTTPGVAFADGGAPGSPRTAPAAADGAPHDAIYLKNGGILRGTIVDAIPNDHARIELVTHEIATVAWGDIARIERGDGGSIPTGPTPPGPAAPPATGDRGDASSTATAPSKSLVWVHIEGSDDATLEQDTTGNDDWAAVCTAPCDRQVSTAYWYRIAGGGIKASSQFTLRGPIGAHETLTVSPASKGWFIAGIVAVPVGGLVAYVGLIVGLAGSLGQAASQSNGSNGSTGNTQASNVSGGVAAVGWTMLAVGGIAAIGGLVLAISNWKTSVQQDAGAQTAALNEAWRLPAPTWREASPEQRATPPAPALPVFTGTF